MQNRKIMLLLVIGILFLFNTANSEDTTIVTRIPGCQLGLAMSFPSQDHNSTGTHNITLMLLQTECNVVTSIPETGANASGVVTKPDGTQVEVNFTDLGNGNYTKNFTFNSTGDYSVNITAVKANYTSVSGTFDIFAGRVEFLNFSSEASVYQGSTMFFNLKVKNYGSDNVEVVPNLYIYDADWNLVYSKQGYSTTLLGNQTVTMLQYNFLTWSVSASPGTYYAKANILYTDFQNNDVYTPSRNLTFTVLPVSSGDDTGGRYVISSGTTLVTIQPSPQPSAAEAVQFGLIPILTETYQGKSDKINIILFNPTEEAFEDVELSVGGLPLEWIDVPENIFSIPKDRGKILELPYSIPENAIPGNYQLKYSFESADMERDFYSLLRIYEVSDDAEVFIYQNAEVQELDKKTVLELVVENKEEKRIRVTIVEEINKSIAENIDEIVFIEKPNKIIEADPVVEWVAESLKPNGIKQITYYVEKVIYRTDPFASPAIRQFTITTEEVEEAEEINLLYYVIIIPIVIVVAIVIVLFKVFRIRIMIKTFHRRTKRRARRKRRYHYHRR